MSSTGDSCSSRISVRGTSKVSIFMFVSSHLVSGESSPVVRSRLLSWSNLLGRLELTPLLLGNPAAAAVDGNGCIAGDGHTPQVALLQAEIRDRAVLGCAIVPDGDVARAPAPAHNILRPGDVILENGEQPLGIGAVETNEILHEVADDERTLATLRMHAHDRMLRLVNGRGEDVAMMLAILTVRSEHLGIVVEIGVDGPEIVDQRLERLGQLLIGRDGIGPFGGGAGFRHGDGPRG